MKTLIYNYAADLKWVSSFAETFGGSVENNYIMVPEHIHTGVRYFKQCDKGIIALYIDVTYNCDVNLIQKNLENDFIGIYYNLMDGLSRIPNDNIANYIGYEQYNLAVIDGSLKTHHTIKKGNRTFALCILIKKEIIKSYAKKNTTLDEHIDRLLDPKKNTFLKVDKMPVESYNLLEELRKLKVGDFIFDLNLIATVNLLISDYLSKIGIDEIIKTVNEADFESIISVKNSLLENIYGQFPGIETISREANMSESKFKLLFKKIIGDTPNSYFMSNKLVKAKELLEEGQYSIADISDHLSFSDNSYFTSKFKNHFGVLPTVFIQQL